MRPTPHVTADPDRQTPNREPQLTFGGPGWRRLLPWAFGMLVLLSTILVVLQFETIESFVLLAARARPGWLLLALLAQAATYPCAALVWHRVLLRMGRPQPFSQLALLAVAKLSADQALPSSGLSGTLLMMYGLARRRLSPSIAMAALLVGLISFDTAYLVVTVAALVIIALHHRMNLAILSGAGLFCVVLVATPIAVITSATWTKWLACGMLKRVPVLSVLVEAVSGAPSTALRQPRLLCETMLLQVVIVLLDAVTLWFSFRALGTSLSFAVVFASFVLASATADLAPLPLGLGTFEAGAVGLLVLLGARPAAALTATLLLRGLAFWLPMLPGLWLARRELSGGGEG